LLVSGGGNDKFVDKALIEELLKVPGIRSAHPRLFTKVKLPELENRSALLIGIQIDAELSNGENQFWTVTLDKTSLKETSLFVISASTISLAGAPFGQGPLLGAAALI